ncbi:MAG: ABC transporter permease [Bacillota bacterium]|nr:ABC transporter permease [Bacillota bacterium]
MRVRRVNRAVLNLRQAHRAVWHLFSWWLNTPTLPRPLAVLQAFLDRRAEEVWGHVWVSGRRILISLGVGLVLGVPLGLYLGRNRRLDAITAPFIHLTYPIPKIVFLPLLLIFLGLGDASRVVLITLAIFFQILVTTRDAARSLPQAAIYSIQSLGGTEWDVYRHVLFPYVLPRIFTALRISIGTAVAVLFFAESFATNSGLGYFIMDSWGRTDYERMFAGIVAMSLLGLTLYLGLETLEYWLCPWEFRGRAR